MGLVRTQKIGEGMLIQGRGKTIDVTILDIGGCEFHRKARFKIEGIAGLSELGLSADQGYFNLTDEIKIGLSNKKEFWEGFVSVNYHAPKYYKLDRKEYKDKYKSKNKSDLNQKEVKNVNHPVGFYYKEESVKI